MPALLLLALAVVLPSPAQQTAKTAPKLAPQQAQNPAQPDQHGPPPGARLFRGRVHPPAGNLPQPGEPTVLDASGLGAPIPLDQHWRLGIASTLDPAKPDFDDSKWPERDAKDALDEIDDSSQTPENHRPENQIPHPHHGRPYAWFRLHVQLPPHHGPLVVMVRVPVSRSAQMAVFSGDVGMDMFLDGKQVFPEDSAGKSPDSFEQISRLYPVAIPDAQTSLVLAVRTPFTPVGLDAYTGFFAHRTFLLGAAEDLRSHLQLWSDQMLFERIPAMVDSGLKLLLAILLLALFWTQRDHREYLWLGLHLVFVAPLAFIGMMGSMGQQPQKIVFALTIQFLLISAYFYSEFLYIFLSLRRRWYILALRYTSPLLLTFGPLLYAIHQGSGIAIGWVLSALFAFVWIVAWSLFVGLNLTVAALRRNFEAALLLLPLLLSVVGMVEFTSTLAASSWVSTPVQSPLTFQAGPIPVHVSDIADFAGIFVILVIIFARFQRIHRERQRVTSELDAARSVQELMIPLEAPKTPGFEVDTVYSPANEVGGDFFHIQPTPDGGLLVVIGDVAGKGLQAAMNVSMLMGALRLASPTSPRAILAELNQVLAGSPSFTTCEAAYFAPSGELIVSSAGHPPPYLNSQEVTLPGGLPLGVAPNVEYDEVHLYLHAGDRLLMISDGIPEARRPNGELFGFDRVRNISSESAFFIADTARAFGQEDDITVLTIRRLAPVHHA